MSYFLSVQVLRTCGMSVPLCCYAGRCHSIGCIVNTVLNTVLVLLMLLMPTKEDMHLPTGAYPEADCLHA